MGFVERQVRKLREEKGLTQYALGKLVGTSQTQINRYETEHGHILAEDLPAFAKALNTTVSYLVTGINDDNYAIAEDLDLTNDSIVALRLEARYVREQQKEENAYIVRNCSKAVIDILLHHHQFVEHLYQYFLRYDFSSFVHGVDDFGDGYSDYERSYVKDIIGFPFKDFERVYRLRILDDLKEIRDSLAPERNHIHEEDMAYEKRTAEAYKRFYQEQQDEEEADPDDALSDEEYYQKMADLISKALRQEGENENGND